MFTTCDMYLSREQKNEKEWQQALAPEFHKQYYKNLCDFICEERKTYTVYPPLKDVFSWTQACSPYDVKVVILGQDPYPGPGQAHGLAFSILPVPDISKAQLAPGIHPWLIPPSLKNIYKELEDEYNRSIHKIHGNPIGVGQQGLVYSDPLFPGTIPWYIPPSMEIEKENIGFKRPNHGYLMGWATQGVLLLNNVLTVREGVPNSHYCKNNGWDQFTSVVISYLNDNMSDLVFMLWGECAKTKGALINTDKHCVLTASHPSNRSATKTDKPFLGCNHFFTCNQYLKRKNRKPIIWALGDIAESAQMLI